MPNSTLLRSAIATYCQWAESISRERELFAHADDLSYGQHYAVLYADNGLIGMNNSMHELFRSAVLAALSANGYSLSEDTYIFDRASGHRPATGEAYLLAEVEVGTVSVTVDINHDGTLRGATCDEMESVWYADIATAIANR